MHPFRRPVLIATLVLGAFLRQADAQDAAAAAPPVFKPEEIEQMVAPIALYPDSLLAQIFMASTYPLEVVEADRWAKANPKVTGKALEDAMQKQSWDPSVKSLTAFPQVLTMMSEKLDMTQKLGDAFLAQQSDVMDAVQRLRAKANAEGNLKTTKEQNVVVEQAPANVQQNVTVEQAAAPPPTIIKIEPADPQVVYVPTYNPTTVYGGWPYPSYPPYSYYPPGYVATASLLSFGAGMAVGAALWGDCNWGGYGGNNNVDINVNNYNNFNNTNISNKNWQHNSEHRKGVQYRDQRTQQKYGRGQSQNAKSRDQFRGRAEQGREQLARGDADRARRDMERGGTGQNRAGQDRAGQNRGGQERARRDSGQQRAGSQGGARDAARKPAQRDSGARSRQASAGSRGGAFDGVGSGSQARQQSNRGHSSRQSAQARGFSGGGSRGGGGGSRGGGGGGGRSGGGGGRRR